MYSLVQTEGSVAACQTRGVAQQPAERGVVHSWAADCDWCRPNVLQRRRPRGRLGRWGKKLGRDFSLGEEEEGVAYLGHGWGNLGRDQSRLGRDFSLAKKINN